MHQHLRIKNIYNESSNIEIELQFDSSDSETIIDESIPVTFAEEELVMQKDFFV